jgi:hypothetical protein
LLLQQEVGAETPGVAVERSCVDQVEKTLKKQHPEEDSGVQRHGARLLITVVTANSLELPYAIRAHLWTFTEIREH